MPTPQELIAEAARLIGEAQEMQVQLTRADLKTMTPEQIVEAHESGRLDHIITNKKES